MASKGCPFCGEGFGEPGDLQDHPPCVGSLTEQLAVAQAREEVLRVALRHFAAWASGYSRPQTGMGAGLHQEVWPALAPAAVREMKAVADAALAGPSSSNLCPKHAPGIAMTWVGTSPCPWCATYEELEDLRGRHRMLLDAVRAVVVEVGSLHNPDDCPEFDCYQNKITRALAREEGR